MKEPNWKARIEWTTSEVSSLFQDVILPLTLSEIRYLKKNNHVGTHISPVSHFDLTIGGENHLEWVV